MLPPETIEAGDLVLRRWAPEFAVEATAAVQESLPELAPFMPWASGAYDLDASHDFIKRSAEKWESATEFNYAIFTAAGELAGSIGLMTRRGPGQLEVGYWMRTRFAGRGHMTTAVRAVSEAGLGLPGVERVVILHDAANGASGAVAAKAGYTEIERVAREPEAPGETGVDVVWEQTRKKR
ncbi:GNAT family N-acetyltransferase [Actinoplanes sp. NPDC000266]